MNTMRSEAGAIRVYVVTGNQMIRELLLRVFGRSAGLEVVGASEGVGTAIEQLTGTPCDVLVLNSLEALQEIAKQKEQRKTDAKFFVVLFGMGEERSRFVEAVRLGASGYLLQEATSAEVVAAVRSAARGEVACPPRLCKALFEYVANELSAESEQVQRQRMVQRGLTFRQRRLMALVARGMTNKEIATELKLSAFTVRNHIRRVMRQVQAESRHEAVRAIRAGGLTLSV